MLDIKFIRANADKVKKAAGDKRIDVNIDELLDIDVKRRELMSEVESLQATKNAASKEIPKLADEEKKVKLLELKEVDARQGEVEALLKNIEIRYNELMLMVPNIPSPESPIGPDDSANLPWSYWGPSSGHVDPKDTEKVALVPTKFDFEVKDHIALANSLGILDLERGAAVSGFRGYYLKNEGVLLHYGIMWYALNKLASKGFKLFSTPTLVREAALIGSGHFPAGKAEVYKVGNAANLDAEDKEAQYLVGTAEPSLLAYYADQILEEKDLPIQMAGISPCYRSEVGSYGKDTKGIYRIHEFMKVEQVIICKADMTEGDKWLEALRETAEELLQDLQIPYRVLNICTGDMGMGKYKMYDIESYMPARKGYGETHSDSNLTDWQARRLNLRYRTKEGEVKHVFTLNNTAVASPRILIAILENFQKADGSVVVPEVLRPYVGKDVLKPL